MAWMGFAHLSNLMPHGINGHEVVNSVRFPSKAMWDWHNSCVTEEWHIFHDGCGCPAQKYGSTQCSTGHAMMANNGNRDSSTS